MELAATVPMKVVKCSLTKNFEQGVVDLHANVLPY